jgi:hypothetical protein
MKNRKQWETKSIDWIHRVRKEMDGEIKRKGMTPTQWIKARGKIDIDELCKKMGLKNITIVEPKLSQRVRRVQTR